MNKKELKIARKISQRKYKARRYAAGYVQLNIYCPIEMRPVLKKMVEGAIRKYKSNETKEESASS